MYSQFNGVNRVYIHSFMIGREAGLNTFTTIVAYIFISIIINSV
jgi:hypothetical protein